MELTSHQQRVARHTDGHALCIAVAGSGKTTTLAYLINNLLQQGNDPRRVMVMMFNKSAQLDFTRKLQQQAQGWQAVPEVRTYHSTGLRLLKSLEKWGLRQGYDLNPLGEKEIELKIRELLLEWAPDTLQDRIKNDTAKYIEAAISFIDRVKTHLSTPEIAFEQADFPDSFRFFIPVYEAFEAWRHQFRRITFTDMLYDTVCLIQQFPEVLSRITNKMDWVIVDEYQDTSTLQHRLTQIIAGERARVVAVGDPDQTIYEFAGANINNILHHFESDYAHTDSVSQLTMPHTFRYGHEIALAASHLISRNKERKDVICLAHPDNPASTIEITQKEGNETAVILNAIQQHLSHTSDSVAVLLRVWAQAVPIELSLLSNSIPYSSEGPSLFDRPEIAALTAVLELSAGQFPFMNDKERGHALNRLFTLPHLGIKGGLVNQLVTELKGLESSMGIALAKIAGQLSGISDYQRKKIVGRAKLLEYLEHTGSSENAATLLQTYIRRSELKESLESMSLNDQRTEEQLLAVDGFVSYLQQIKRSTTESCHHINELQQKQQKSRSKRQDSNQQSVIISSCHKAKGLEWPVVMIPGLTTQYWPFQREDDLGSSSREELESERRLLYVAMTRARKKLHLFTCTGSLELKTRSWSEPKGQQISRFLKEMQLPHVQSITRKLDENGMEALISEATEKGLTKQSKQYIAAIKPEWSDQILSAPSLASIKKQSEALRTPPVHSLSYRAAKESILSRDEPEDAPWKVHRQLRHTIFGEGKVIEVNDSNFVILFNSEHGVKRFARSSQVLHLFEVL